MSNTSTQVGYIAISVSLLRCYVYQQVSTRGVTSTCYMTHISLFGHHSRNTLRAWC